MKYKKLGNTDIELSLIGLGTMTWGEQNTLEEGFAQMDLAVEMGINFFDVAELYPVAPREETYGRTEEITGQWLKQRGLRDKIFLASKVTGRSDRNSDIEYIRNGARLSKEHIFTAIEGSLKRLSTDYLDLYQIHWPERSTNFFGTRGYSHTEDDGIALEETHEAMNELVKQGKVRHIGISNETPWGMMAYDRLAREKGWARMQSIQNPYSLLNRTFEVGGSEICIRENISFLAYSPLGFGVLTGKYLNGAKPEGARLSKYERFQRYSNPQAIAATQAYVHLARENGLNPAQMALAYVNSRDFMCSNIIGATNLEQLKENIDSANIELSNEVLEAIEAIHNQSPDPAP